VTVFGSYELEQRLGAGGMGEVFLGKRAGDPTPIVIKRILPALAKTPGFVDRFLDEVRVLARLQHPNVVRVFDFGEVQGQWYLAMEFVPGRELRKVKPVSLAQTLRVGLEISSALSAAHELKDPSGRATPVIHRDVSPHNILVADDGSTKLIDFGVASLGKASAQGGKLAYAAPEQLMEDETSPLSDQYSLGVTLWECLAGKPAFSGDDVEVMRRVTEVGVPALEGQNPELTRVIARMTSLEPAARFPRLDEARSALKGIAKALKLEVSSSQARALTHSGLLRAVKRITLSPVEQAALDVLVDGMTAEEAEAAIDAAKLEGQPFALDLLQELVEKGALRAEDVGVLRRFRK